MDRLTLELHKPDALGAIARALEEAPQDYCRRLASSNDRQRLRAVDALAGWIGAHLVHAAQPYDEQLMLPIDG